MRGVPDDYYPDDLEPVPTGIELVGMGLATVAERNKSGEVSIVNISPAGYTYLADIMIRNAAKTRAQHERRTREAAQDDPPDQ